MRLCSGRGFGCGLGSRLLRGLAAGTHIPTLALICPIHMVVPVGSLRRRRIRRCKTIIGARGIGHPDVLPETRSVTTNPINPTSLGVFPDTIPSTTPDPRKTSLQNSTAMRCNCEHRRKFQKSPPRIRPGPSALLSTREPTGHVISGHLSLRTIIQMPSGFPLSPEASLSAHWY